MQRLEVSGAVRPIYGSLGVKRLILTINCYTPLALVDLRIWWSLLCVYSYDFG